MNKYGCLFPALSPSVPTLISLPVLEFLLAAFRGANSSDDNSGETTAAPTCRDIRGFGRLMLDKMKAAISIIQSLSRASLVWCRWSGSLHNQRAAFSFGDNERPDASLGTSHNRKHVIVFTNLCKYNSLLLGEWKHSGGWFSAASWKHTDVFSVAFFFALNVTHWAFNALLHPWAVSWLELCSADGWRLGSTPSLYPGGWNIKYEGKAPDVCSDCEFHFFLCSQ